jgi:AraC-like DNA-binding protein
MVSKHREKDRPLASLAHLPNVDNAPADVICKAIDYPADTLITPHRHLHHHQLIFAIHGLIVVTSGHGRWVVPSTRALWMPAGTVHAVRCIGLVQMRNLYVRPRVIAGMPAQPSVVEVGPLLTELIRHAAMIPWDHRPDSRDGRLMRLILDELHALPELPLHLPEPNDPRLQRICDALQDEPADASTLEDWATRLQLDVKTVQRLFQRELGMTFGQWRQQVRLLRGLERLAVGEKIIDVALALGYDSPSAFTAMFRRQFGQPPSRFFA